MRIAATLLALFLMLVAPAMAAPPRLHLQPSRPEVLGDGDDQITLTITARDELGEVRTDLSGPLRLSLNMVHHSASLKISAGGQV